mmetsp:Transcript_11694/g.16396  ORF Transcript_11694/g.16396 Transcript_11694/m.16396 type:complete len:116 (+) Transcript_11694:303-650(+)
MMAAKPLCSVKAQSVKVARALLNPAALTAATDDPDIVKPLNFMPVDPPLISNCVAPPLIVQLLLLVPPSPHWITVFSVSILIGIKLSSPARSSTVFSHSINTPPIPRAVASLTAS